MTAVVERLPPHPESAGRARRLLADALHSWNLDDLVDVASLLVSEVVTNAVIHAGTEIVVSVQAAAGGVRVQVADGSPGLPSRRHYDADAMTGRGLGLVESLSAAWGVEAGEAGKAVWFALGTDDGEAPAGPHPATPPAAAAASAAGHEPEERHVVLAGAPLRLVRSSAQYADALLREAAVMALGGEPLAGAEARWDQPAMDVSPLVQAVHEALDRGETVADLVVAVPPDAAAGAVRRLAMVDDADRLAREGALLSPASLPELGACRRWYLGEIARQLEGAPPAPWALPDVPATREGPVLGADQRDALARLSPAVVAADDTNHIVFVNDEAASLLGWTVDELTGRRLTTIIPPQLREAHLVGYTRYQLTKELRLAGAPVALPALRRDGSTVEIALELSPLTAGGRTIVVARLHATS